MPVDFRSVATAPTSSPRPVRSSTPPSDTSSFSIHRDTRAAFWQTVQACRVGVEIRAGLRGLGVGFPEGLGPAEHRVGHLRLMS